MFPSAVPGFWSTNFCQIDIRVPPGSRKLIMNRKYSLMNDYVKLYRLGFTQTSCGLAQPVSEMVTCFQTTSSRAAHVCSAVRTFSVGAATSTGERPRTRRVAAIAGMHVSEENNMAFTGAQNSMLVSCMWACRALLCGMRSTAM